MWATRGMLGAAAALLTPPLLKHTLTPNKCGTSRFFQELDFPWSLDPSLLQRLLPRVLQIVADEAAAVHGLPRGAAAAAARPLVSMRTLYKVHLNFPAVITVEAKARKARRAAINRCRIELSGLQPLRRLREEAALDAQVETARQALAQLQALAAAARGAGCQLAPGTEALLTGLGLHDAEPPLQQPQQQEQEEEEKQGEEGQKPLLPALHEDPLVLSEADAEALRQLDWEAVLDVPHGSLRLLGSCKTPWMDTDPGWVAEKCYAEAECDAAGKWIRHPLSRSALAAASILLSATEQRVYEAGDDFLDAAYSVRPQHATRSPCCRKIMCWQLAAAH